MKWRDMVRGCMVCTERAKRTAVSRGTSHVTAKRCKYITSVQIKTRYVELLSLILNHTLQKRSECSRARYIKAIMELMEKVLSWWRSCGADVEGVELMEKLWS